jgi:hypothetical protein
LHRSVKRNVECSQSVRQKLLCYHCQ